MAEADLVAAVKAVQKQLENQSISFHQTLQQYMAMVDSQLEDLRSHIHGSPGRTADTFPIVWDMKMEVPKFDGTDTDSWIFRIEEFFEFQGTPESIGLRIVSFHMEGRAATWFQSMKTNQLLTNWKGFLKNVKLRFGASLYEDYQGKLSKLSQTTTVAEFQSAFEDLMYKVTGISEPLLVSFFISGLKPELRRELLFARPSSLMETFALARAHEARMEETQSSHRLGPKWGTVLAKTPNLPLRRFSAAELREKREKGLRYNPDDDEDNTPDLNCDGDASEKPITADISSLYALAVQSNPRCLRLWGEIDGQMFDVLVDRVGTHNFIKPSLAERLGLSLHPTNSFRVSVGNGDYLVCRHICVKVPLKLQNHEFLVDFYVLPIERPERTLGVQWLQGLGKVTNDYTTMTMEFDWEGRHFILRRECYSLYPTRLVFHFRLPKL